METITKTAKEILPSNVFNTLSEVTNALGGLELPPIFIDSFAHILSGNIPSNLPMPLQILAHVVINRARYATNQAYYAAIRKAAEEANLITKSTVKVKPESVNRESNQQFPGFADLSHIVLVGSTGAGKTAWVITELMKTPSFASFEKFVYVASAVTKNENVQNMRKAVLVHLNTVEDDHFVFFHNTKLLDAVSFIKNAPGKKLVFFDDMQASLGQDLVNLAKFTLEAKNVDATVITSLHKIAGEGEKTIRDASKYFVLFNVGQDVFNRLVGAGGTALNLKANNDLWIKYRQIPPPYTNRVIIVDKMSDKLYYGTNEQLDFSPLVQKIQENTV